jgi:hypothetical protein
MQLRNKYNVCTTVIKYVENLYLGTQIKKWFTDYLNHTKNKSYQDNFLVQAYRKRRNPDNLQITRLLALPKLALNLHFDWLLLLKEGIDYFSHLFSKSRFTGFNPMWKIASWK